MVYSPSCEKKKGKEVSYNRPWLETHTVTMKGKEQTPGQ